MDKKEIIEMLLKRVDLRGLLVDDLLKSVLNNALDELVKKTDNPYDDMFKAAAYPLIEAELIKQVDELIAKLKA